jgi:predicted kinase
MRKVILMKGLPGSGKSTLAKKMMSDYPDCYKKINRDGLRAMFDEGKTSKKSEHFIRKIRDLLIVESLKEGKNVIVDDTNLSETNLQRITQVVSDYNHQFHQSVKIEVLEVKTDIEVCIARDALRPNPVGEKVIRHMQQQFFKDKPDYAIQNAALPPAILCDLDGTLALMNGRNPFNASTCDADDLNQPVANVLKNYAQLGYKIVLVTGREEQFKAPTLRFLAKHNVNFDALFMRRTHDNRKDALVKAEIYHRFIKNNYYVEFVLDDRNQVVDMWRNELKLPCFQVYYGDF